MSVVLSSGVFVPPSVEATPPVLVSGGNAELVKVVSIESFAGAAIGNAILALPLNRPDNPTVSIGEEATIKIGEDIVFDGIVGYAPAKIDTTTDELQLVLFDAKWLMAANRIGQWGIGLEGLETYGFSDVALEVVFNADGIPNKDPDALDFCLGSNAVYWTLRDVMNFIFQYYIDDTVATCPAAQIAHSAYDAEPSNLNLIGQTALQAVNAVAELAGETWTLIPGETASTFRSVRPGSGTIRTASFFKPFAGAKATGATENHPSEGQVAISVKECRDSFQAMSGNRIKETTYSVANGLLSKVSGFKDKEYHVRFKIDVTKYFDNNLGLDLSDGAPPKKTLSHLCTRINDDANAYITAAELTATPALRKCKQVEIPVWISADGTTGNAKLCKSGYRIDHKHGTVDFVEHPVTWDQWGFKDQALVVDWDIGGVWVTLATETEQREVVETDTLNQYLPTPMYEFVKKDDLKPESRVASWLPDLASSSRDAVTIIAPSGEDYVSVTDALEETVDRMLQHSAEIETPIDLMLPFFPWRWQVGDRLQLAGRSLGATGDEVITEIRHDVHEAFNTRVRATNVMKSVDPEKFVRKRGK